MASLQHPNIVRYITSWLTLNAAPVSLKTTKRGKSRVCFASSSENDEDDNEDGGEAINGRLPPANQRLAYDNSDRCRIVQCNGVSTPFNGGPKFIIRSSLWIQMELCQYSLTDWLEDRLERMSITPLVSYQRQARWIMDQLASGVAYLHSNDVMHRDLKPQNILISGPPLASISHDPCLCRPPFLATPPTSPRSSSDEDLRRGQVTESSYCYHRIVAKICDFGLARLHDFDNDDRLGNKATTTTSSLIPSPTSMARRPSYMAAENKGSTDNRRHSGNRRLPPAQLYQTKTRPFQPSLSADPNLSTDDVHHSSSPNHPSPYRYQHLASPASTISALTKFLTSSCSPDNNNNHGNIKTKSRYRGQSESSTTTTAKTGKVNGPHSIRTFNNRQCQSGTHTTAISAMTTTLFSSSNSTSTTDESPDMPSNTKHRFTTPTRQRSSVSGRYVISSVSRQDSLVVFAKPGVNNDTTTTDESPDVATNLRSSGSDRRYATSSISRQDSLVVFTKSGANNDTSTTDESPDIAKGPIRQRSSGSGCHAVSSFTHTNNRWKDSLVDTTTTDESPDVTNNNYSLTTPTRQRSSGCYGNSFFTTNSSRQDISFVFAKPGANNDTTTTDESPEVADTNTTDHRYAAPLTATKNNRQDSLVVFARPGNSFNTTTSSAMTTNTTTSNSSDTSPSTASCTPTSKAAQVTFNDVSNCESKSSSSANTISSNSRSRDNANSSRSLPRVEDDIDDDTSHSFQSLYSFNKPSTSQSSDQIVSDNVGNYPTRGLSSSSPFYRRGGYSVNIGSALYAAPEVMSLTGRRVFYGLEADIYSLGVIFLELCYPFRTRSELVHALQCLKMATSTISSGDDSKRDLVVYPPSNNTVFDHLMAQWPIEMNPSYCPSSVDLANFSPQGNDPVTTVDEHRSGLIDASDADALSKSQLLETANIRIAQLMRRNEELELLLTARKQQSPTT